MGIVSIFVLMGLAFALIIYSIMPKNKDGKDAVKRRLKGNRKAAETVDISAVAKATADQNAMKTNAPVLSKIILPMSAEDQSQLRIKLVQAGYRNRQAQTIFLASKTAILVLGLIAGGIIGPSLGYDFKVTLALMLFTGAIGFVAPGFWLSSMVSSRQGKIRRGLPDILDLLVVSVESGLALDAGLKRVGEEMAMVHVETSEEFRIATMEAQMGIPRAEALKNLAERVGLDELRSLVSVITQAERFGTSVSKALRTLSDTMRTKRRQVAEEKAQKTAVKLMIPLVLFIFPAMGIVLAGPAAINLMEAFGDK